MAFHTDRFLYGGDYNPDQWLEQPEILEKDIILMKKAHINIVSLGIFAWAKLEPEDGRYEFDWLEEIINRLYENGIYTNLATPSGARPHWLADRYPEVLRVNNIRQREIFGTRHNHCYTSPAYRKKVYDINYALAKRFDSNPAVVLWHISNEYGGECHCQLCQDAFRGWLRKKYGSLSRLNKAWNTSFWSHDYQSWEQIESPSPIGEDSIHGLDLDWKTFVSDQTVDFCRCEIDAIREAGGKKPATTNMMYQFTGLNYTDFADILDVICWDSYPLWGSGNDYRTALDYAMTHDFMRSIKHQPFLLMESSPGPTNWQPISKLKKPGLLQAASIQAVAHGSDSVMYFQIRKGRGGFEKFHGAVIDHYGKEDDRTYQECKEIGSVLRELDEITGSEVSAEAAIIWDTKNRWAVEGAAGPRNQNLQYMDCVKKNYFGLRKLGINVDVIDETQSIDGYKLVIGPMLYMFREGFAEKVRSYVKNGGTYVSTYWSGVVDEYDLCYLGGTPGQLMDVFGLRSAEIDALYDGEENQIADENGKTYTCRNLCQLVKTTTAETLSRYQKDFYAGTPALTRNSYGDGSAYYICADVEQAFYDDFYDELTSKVDIHRPIKGSIEEGVEVSSREKNGIEYVFVQNFSGDVHSCPDVDGLQLIFTESEYMGPDGEIYYFSDNAGKDMRAYECRIYKREKTSTCI